MKGRRLAHSFIIKANFYSLFGKARAKKINRMVIGKLPVYPDVLEFMDVMMTHIKAPIEKEYIFTDTELKSYICQCYY